MKRIITIVVVSLLLFATTAQAVLTYDSDYYLKNLGYVATGVKNRDPVYLNMGEVETLLDLIQYGSIGTGSVFYVDSSVSVPGNGTTITAAKATLDEAINLCENDRGDLIFVLQGHTEAMGAGADEVDIDVDGVTIIQVGSNTISNGFDYTGTTTGAFAISGDNVTLINLRFHANVPDVTEAVDLEASATRVSFIGCLFDAENPGTDEFYTCIDQGGANVNQLAVRGCDFRMGAGAAVSAIDLIDSDYAKIIGNFFEGDYSTANVLNATTASIHILITDNVMINGNAGGAAGLNTEPCIELLSTTSGVITGNTLICNEATPDAAIVGADMWVLDNFYQEAEGGVSAAPMWFSTDTLENKIGVDDSSNLGTTSNVTADADGSILERLEFVQAQPATDSATNYLGVDDAANLGLTTAVVADVDGSVLERLEDLSERQLGTTLTAGKSYTVTAATASITASTSPLFTIAGGPIRITDFVGVSAGSIGASDMLIQSISTVGTVTFPFTTNVGLDSDPAGTFYTFTGAVPSVLTPLLGAQNLSAQAALNWYAPVGTVDQLGDAAVSGIINWYMTFIPLVEGVTVTDAT